jgi:hypothetical protein
VFRPKYSYAETYLKNVIGLYVYNLVALLAAITPFRSVFKIALQIICGFDVSKTN